MTCIRCEIVRAKILAMGLAGLRRDVETITKELIGRYGQDYYRKGRCIFRKVPTGDELIFEGRR